MLTNFLVADDSASLLDAFDTIAEAVVPCEYDIDDPDASADPDKVNFYFDDEVVPYDEDCAEGIGWTWTDESHTAVEFCNLACDQLLLDVSMVTAKFGCPTVYVE